jgi:hypothetical protein
MKHAWDFFKTLKIAHPEDLPGDTELVERRGAKREATVSPRSFSEHVYAKDLLYTDTKSMQSPAS